MTALCCWSCREDGERACANVRNHSRGCLDVCNETLPQVTPRYPMTEPGMWQWPGITELGRHRQKDENFKVSLGYQRACIRTKQACVHGRWCLCRPEDCVGSPGIDISGGSSAIHPGCWELNASPLGENRGLLTIESFLQPSLQSIL